MRIGYEQHVKLAKQISEPLKLQEALIAIEDFDGKDGEKIAAEIVDILVKENLSINAAENVMQLVKNTIMESAVNRSLSAQDILADYVRNHSSL